MPANGKPNRRFELPALTPVTFSLTDGTDIPPPPDSPIEETATPPAPKETADRASTAPANGAAAPTTAANGAYDGRGGTTTTVENPPLSPASTTRPSSIRRFLSRKSLNTNYTNGTNHNGSHEDLTGIGRPDSPSSFLSAGPSLIKKKSGSWFSKLGGSSGKRTSVVYENPPPEKKAKGPPPPKLPELNQLKAKIADDDEGSLGGGEMFKNIRGE